MSYSVYSADDSRNGIPRPRRFVDESPRVPGAIPPAAQLHGEVLLDDVDPAYVVVVEKEPITPRLIADMANASGCALRWNGQTGCVEMQDTSGCWSALEDHDFNAAYTAWRGSGQ